MTAPITHGTVVARGLRLHYVEQGSGAPVLLLHGFPEYSGAWHGVMERLAPHCRTIALDTRGIGRSEAAADVQGYDIAELVRDVRDVVAALGLAKVTLVGHDWGGFIAWEVAMRHPELLDRLVIVNAAHTCVFEHLLHEDAEQARASQYMLAFRSARGEELVSRNDFAGFRREMLDPARAAGALSDAQADDYLRLWRDSKSVSAGLNYYRANKSGPPSGDDRAPRPLEQTRVTVPTLVIWGDKDVYFTPRTLELLPTVVPDLRVRRFADCDHWIVHQQPDAVAALIAGFVEGRLER
jgi:pimeloyl-ACP methyl ester carboxylesterase